MKKILLIFVCLCCMFISCSKDDSVQEPVFAKNELVQTTWSGCQYFYNDKDEIKETIEDFKVDFQNANEAIYIDSVGYSYFNYKLVNRRIWCSGGIPGYWTLVEKTRNRMVLQIYNPQNEMFAHFQTKRIISKNETQLFKVIPHTPKFQKKSTGFAGTKYI